MNKKVTIGLIAFLVICLGTIAYVQWDKHLTEKAALQKQQKIEEQLQKEKKAMEDDLKKGDPLKKALEKQKQQQ